MTTKWKHRDISHAIALFHETELVMGTRILLEPGTRSGNYSGAAVRTNITECCGF